MSTWILLRGLMREQRHWGRFPGQLSRALPGATLVTPDLPGNGVQYAATSPTSVADMVAACRADLRARGVRPPYSLLALSLGGMMAVEWASRHPDELTRAVLVNTSMRPFSRFHQRLRWRNYGAIVRMLLDGGVAAQERLILRLTSRHGDNAERDGLLRRWLAYQQQFPVSRANALRQLLAAARYRAPATRPALPLLVLSSSGDQLVDPDCSRQLAAAWRTEHRIHPNAGHDLPLDDGDWVAQRVAAWVGSADLAAEAR
ncbi:hydrolase [Duganella sp. Leaf126]|uniref:alpha/beta fold hydrolase n=1 Tax=Duganella sp. Leaf126 TaxID=1736266 RepID=UPI0006F705C0|nr:alpha/beta hydrolase [Duganella sp. Leaf126]KQQ47516.1 hydrolase [Duganella sp. Leaf126]